jgi:hypothetical protein
MGAMNILRPLALGAVTLLTALTLPAAATAAPGPDSPQVIGDCAHRSVMPRKVIATCADGNEWAIIKQYDTWGKRQATGSGRLHMNDCDPSCAGGTFRSYRATFRFYRVVDTAKGPLFTRLGVTYVQGGEQHDVQLSLPRRPL